MIIVMIAVISATVSSPVSVIAKRHKFLTSKMLIANHPNAYLCVI